MIVVPGTIGITVPISPRAISTIANSHQNASMGLVNRDPSMVNRQLTIQRLLDLFLTGLIWILYGNSVMPLAVGTKAPDFTLPTKTSDGPKQVTLSENFG